METVASRGAAAVRIYVPEHVWRRLSLFEA